MSPVGGASRPASASEKIGLGEKSMLVVMVLWSELQWSVVRTEVVWGYCRRLRLFAQEKMPLSEARLT